MINDVTDIKTVVIIRKNGIDNILRVEIQSGNTFFVPIDDGNSDYRKYLKWVALKNKATIEDE